MTVGKQLVYFICRQRSGKDHTDPDVESAEMVIDFLKNRWPNVHVVFHSVSDVQLHPLYKFLIFCPLLRAFFYIR